MPRSRRKSKVIRSPLSEYPNLKEINWRDFIPELLFLGSLVQTHRNRSLSVFQQIRAVIQTASSIEFDGSVSAWERLATLHREVLRDVASAVPAFFQGATGAIFRQLSIPGRDDVLPTLGPAEPSETVDAVAIMRLVGDMMDNQGYTASLTKALHLYAIAPQPYDSTPTSRSAHSFATNALADPTPEHLQMARASWVALVATRSDPSHEWGEQLWAYGLNLPCVPQEYVKPSQPPWPRPDLEPIAQELDAIILEVLQNFAPSLDYPIWDVLSGLIARMRTLLSFVLSAGSRDEGEAAEIFLRCLADTNITLRWLLLQEDMTVYLRFQQHSYEQEKQSIGALEHMVSNSADEDTPLRRGIAAEYGKLQKDAGRWPGLMGVTLGPWNGLSSAKMAEEIGDGDEAVYKVTFARGSDAVHGSWRDLRRFHLDECLNPLHQRHHIPVSGLPRSAGTTPVVGGLMTTLQGVNAFLDTVAPPEHELRVRSANLTEELREWTEQHFDPDKGGWAVD